MMCNGISEYVPTKRGFPVVKTINPYEKFKTGWKKVSTENSLYTVEEKQHYVIHIDPLPNGVPGAGVWQEQKGAFRIINNCSLYYEFNQDSFYIEQVPDNIQRSKRNIWLKGYVQYLIDEPDELAVMLALRSMPISPYLNRDLSTVIAEEVPA
jgi:hypothetical protein